MLTGPEQQAFLRSVERVRGRMAPALARSDGTATPPDNADRTLGVVSRLHAALDAVATRASAAGPAPACRPGCAHCCRLPVQATDPELLCLAREVRGWSPSAQAALRGRLQAHAPGQACAFLQDERCTVYDHRPGVCRKAHALSRAPCEAGAAQIPQNLAWIVDAEALITGTSLAYQDAGLPSAAHELNAALSRLLSSDGAETRWLAGHDVFTASAP